MVVRQNMIKGIVLFFVVILMSLGAVAWYFIGELESWYNRDLRVISHNEWTLLITNHDRYYEKAILQGQVFREEIRAKINQEYSGDVESIRDDIENYLNPDNKIRSIVNDTIKNYYFESIINDSNDPFVTLGERIVWDDSGNCSTFGSSRTFEEEFPMHANPYLARRAFYRINSGSLDYLKEPIFFQFINCPNGVNVREDYPEIYDSFKDKKAVILSAYDSQGLKNLYDKNDSWEETFSCFEFIAPVYIYEKEDLSGRKFIENGINKGIPRLTINIVFNYADVIKNDPELKAKLENYDHQRADWYRFRIQTERILLLTIFLLVIISSMAMYVTLKITEGVGHVGTRKLQS